MHFIKVTFMGRKSKEEGIYLFIWLIHFAIQQKLIQHCKATVLQLKKYIKLKSERYAAHHFIEDLAATVGILAGLISISLCLREQGGLSIRR